MQNLKKKPEKKKLNQTLEKSNLRSVGSSFVSVAGEERRTAGWRERKRKRKMKMRWEGKSSDGRLERERKR